MSMAPPAVPPLPGLGVLTTNIHMGLDMLQRRFVLPRLREAISARASGARSSPSRRAARARTSSSSVSS